MFRAAFKFPAFVIMTFAAYAPWFFTWFLRDKNGRRRLRERCFGNWAWWFVRIANADLKIVGAPPKAPFLLVSNHTGYFDIAALRASVNCVFVAKADIDGWFAAGRIVRDMGTIFIKREQKRDIPRAGAEIVEALTRGEGVVIFAEGTSSDGTQVLPFKSSFLEFAARRDLPVYYASLNYQTAAGDPPAAKAVCWWGHETGFLPHLWEFFKLRGFSATVTFGAQPIQSNDRKTLAEQLRAAVAREHEKRVLEIRN